jgi:hypothetical protein
MPSGCRPSHKLNLPAVEFLAHHLEVQLGAFDLGEEFFFLFLDVVFDFAPIRPLKFAMD